MSRHTSPPLTLLGRIVLRAVRFASAVIGAVRPAGYGIVSTRKIAESERPHSGERATGTPLPCAASATPSSVRVPASREPLSTDDTTPSGCVPPSSDVLDALRGNVSR